MSPAHYLSEPGGGGGGLGGGRIQGPGPAAPPCVPRPASASLGHAGRPGSARLVVASDLVVWQFTAWVQLQARGPSGGPRQQEEGGEGVP